MTLRVAALLLLAAGALAEPIVIRAPRLIDGRGTLLRNAAVVVDGTKILAIETRPKRVDIDLPGATLMPGGIDTHVHIAWHFDAADGRSHVNETDRDETPAESVLYAAENAYRTLLGGITTVQSLGSAMDEPLRDAIARGTLPGPRILTSLDPILDVKLTPAELRELVAKRAAAGADVIKVFASQSIRTGGGPTMSQEQLDAICSAAREHRLRVAVHAHGPESAQRAVRARCTSIEHGALLDPATLELIAAHGLYYDPNTDLIFRNYFEHKPRFLGTPGYTEEGFAAMEKAVPRVLEVFKTALRTKGLKIVFGTDALAGSHGRNFQELIYRVRKGGQDPMAAITSAPPSPPNP